MFCAFNFNNVSISGNISSTSNSPAINVLTNNSTITFENLTLTGNSSILVDVACKNAQLIIKNSTFEASESNSYAVYFEQENKNNHMDSARYRVDCDFGRIAHERDKRWQRVVYDGVFRQGCHGRNQRVVRRRVQLDG